MLEDHLAALRAELDHFNRIAADLLAQRAEYIRNTHAATVSTRALLAHISHLENEVWTFKTLDSAELAQFEGCANKPGA